MDGTLVGDSALWGLGVLDRMHLPLMMRDNILTPYANATGGNIDSDFRIAAIEKSFARIAAEARYRYYVGYYSHEPFIDGKYRKVEVVVLNHGNNLTVLAKKGYWPAAMEIAAAHYHANDRANAVSASGRRFGMMPWDGYHAP